MRYLALALLLAGCGSGAVTDPANTPTPAPLTVTPSSATLTPGLPTTFLIGGGSGTYSIVSDNQAVVANPPVTGNAFVVVPNNVATRTTLNLSVRDTSSSVTVPVTVEALATVPLAARPTTLLFQGALPNTCSSNVSADVLVYGGQPPYVVSQPGPFVVNPTTLTSNPGRLTVTSTGQCAAATQIAIVDSLGAAVTVTASNTLSTATAPPTPAFAASPLTVGLFNCNDVARVILVGGTGRYFAASGNDVVYATIEGQNTGLIGRVANRPAPTAPVQVAFSDGMSVVTVTVNLSADAAGSCP